MAKRSVTINLVNNTPYYLQHYWEAVCNGSWGPTNGTPPPGPAAPNASMPNVIPPNSLTSLSSADAQFSIGKGTEAWIKYSILCTPPLAGANLLYIHWDNPYVWANNDPPNSDPIVASCVILSEGIFNKPYANLPNGEPCQQQPTPWPAGSTGSVTASGLTGTQGYGVAAGQTITPAATQICDVVTVTNSASGPPTFSWGTSGAGPAFDVVLGWPELIATRVIDLETDVNLDFTMILRSIGSIGQSIGQVYDGAKGLRALATQQGQPSLRKLFAM